MALVLSLKGERGLYFGREYVEFVDVQWSLVTVRTEDGGVHEVFPDHMTEILPCVLVSCRGLPEGRGSARLVIEAPRSLEIRRRSPGQGEPHCVPGFREVVVGGFAGIQASAFGLSRSRVREMARLSVPLQEVRWNRRYKDYLMRVEGSLLAEIGHERIIS